MRKNKQTRTNKKLAQEQNNRKQSNKQKASKVKT